MRDQREVGLMDAASNGVSSTAALVDEEGNQMLLLQKRQREDVLNHRREEEVPSKAYFVNSSMRYLDAREQMAYDFCMSKYGEDGRIPMYNVMEKKRLFGNCLPMKKGVDKFLTKHPDHEVYYGQTMLVSRRSVLGPWFEGDVHCPVDPTPVPVWDSVAEAKIEDRSKWPLTSTLHNYFAKHPTHQIYMGQDKKGFIKNMLEAHKEGKVLIWDAINREVMKSKFCPSLSEVLGFLRELENKYTEVYVGQDLEPFRLKEGVTIPSDWKRPCTPVAVVPQDEERVLIWKKSSRRKLTGNCMPLRRTLDEYLRTHPDCEVYNGQDRLGHAEMEENKGGMSAYHPRNGFFSSFPSSFSSTKSYQPTPRSLAGARRYVIQETDDIYTNPLLECPFSKLADVQLKDVLSITTFLECLTESQRVDLMKYLPKEDLTPEALYKLFSSKNFRDCCSLYQELLGTGYYDPDMKVRGRLRRRRNPRWNEQKEIVLETYLGEHESISNTVEKHECSELLEELDQIYEQKIGKGFNRPRSSVQQVIDPNPENVCTI